MTSAGERPRVYVIGTGGSISCVGASRTDLIDYGHGDRHYGIDEMLARVPEATQVAEVRAEQFLNVYGGEVSPARWVDLARRINAIFRDDPRCAGIVVTHGTSALEETAYFLNLTVKSRKPVVVTGAMRPMTAISNDAEINLYDGIRVAASPAAAGRGVLVVLNNQIQAARDVTKTNTSRLDTFKSGDFGYLGYADSDGSVVFYRAPEKVHTIATEFDVDRVDGLPRVDIALAYAGVDGTAIRALAAAGAAGVVAAGMGSGGATAAFMDALEDVARGGVPVVVASQAGGGRTMARRALIGRGLIVADNLLPRKARILLMLGLTRTRDPAALQEILYRY